MHKLWIAIVSLALFSMGNLSFAAEPVAQPQSKTTASTLAKQQAVKQAAAKPPAKPAAPKYYYVRATPLAAVPVAAAAAQVPVQQAQAVAPEAGEVHTGRMVCELGNSVTVSPDPQQPERFIVQMKKNTYLMTPVATTTGAVRLEDAQAGAMWMQLPHKSMLMNSKLGQRMADECQSEHQVATAHAMKLNPPPSLLDGPTLAKK
nr:hypothetical protein [uncultured Limnohabitans sp.]